MRKLILIPYVITTIMLTLMAMLGTVNTYQLYVEHGWSYDVTTIIKEVSTTSTVYLENNIIAVIFITWITVIMIYTIRLNG